MTSPDFLIIGSQKSGSTWLARNIGQHPKVFLYKKEIHFFDKDENYSKGIEWYSSHFSNLSKEILIGEKTPDYFDSDLSRQRIASNLPEAKLIIVLRDPIQRAISAVNHYKNNGELSPCINLDNLFEGILNEKPKNILLEDKFGFLRKGYYFQHLKKYLESFSPDQLLILIYEKDIVQKPHEGLKKVCDFLQCDYEYDFFAPKISKYINRQRKSFLRLFFDFYSPRTKKINEKLVLFFPGKPLRKSLNNNTLSLLNAHYVSHNQELFNHIANDFNPWI